MEGQGEASMGPKKNELSLLLSILSKDTKKKKQKIIATDLTLHISLYFPTIAFLYFFGDNFLPQLHTGSPPGLLHPSKTTAEI